MKSFRDYLGLSNSCSYDVDDVIGRADRFGFQNFCSPAIMLYLLYSGLTDIPPVFTKIILNESLYTIKVVLTTVQTIFGSVWFLSTFENILMCLYGYFVY